MMSMFRHVHVHRVGGKGRAPDHDSQSGQYAFDQDSSLGLDAIVIEHGYFLTELIEPRGRHSFSMNGPCPYRYVAITANGIPVFRLPEIH